MSSIGSSIITQLGVFAVVIKIIFYMALYGIFCFGLYTIALKRNEHNAILSWIPLANIYLLGSMIGNFTILNKEIKNVEILLPLSALIYFGISGWWIFSYLLAAFCLLFMIYTLYVFYEQIQPDKAILYTICSAVLPIIAIPVIFFLIKDK